ncbi:MAG: LysR family transcriptional regulator [Pseudomonadota bacterium]
MTPFQGKLRIRQLEIVLAVADQGTLSKAAEQLDVTQSGLSRAIAGIEEMTGGRLFERSAKGMVKTSLGDALCRHARTLLSDYSKAETEMRAVTRGNLGSLTIGCFSMFSGWPLAQAVELYRQGYPKVVVAIETGTHEKLLIDLDNGALDVLVSRYIPTLNSDLYRSVTLLQDKVVIAVSPNHPLARKKKVELAHCVDYPWLTALQGARLRSEVENLLHRRQLPVPEMIGALSPEFGLEMIAGGRYIWMVAGSVAQVLQDRGRLRILPVDLPIKSSPLAAIWRRGRSSTREVRAFTAALAAVIQQTPL